MAHMAELIENYLSPNVTTLLAAMVGGGLALLATLLQQRRDARVRKEQLLRERGEELYGAAGRWINALAAYALRRTALMQGKITYNQCNDMDISLLGELGENFDAGRIELLIHVYFPSARKAFDDPLTEREKLNSIEIPFKRDYEQYGPPVTDSSGAYANQMMVMNAKATLLLEEIIKAVRKID
jgi:hypothetical protein